MTNYDHYTAARDVISRLKAEGHAADASKLQAAIEEGATGTEILMALRFHLSEIIRNVILQNESKKKALELLSELNNALK